MATTIQISDETKQVLASLKSDKLKTYDDIIKALIKREKVVPESMFGKYPQLRWNKEEDRMRFDGE